MVTAGHRSVHPNVPGVPWWGAVLIAVTATALGFAFDAGAGTQELTNVFAAMYAIGCLAAVLMVRQAAIFTAVVQPPVLMFISVPGAYYLFHGSEITGLKDVLITCGYPLIVRFPLMLFTSAAVLLIGLARWYVGMSSREAVNTDGKADSPQGLLTTLSDKASGNSTTKKSDEDKKPKRRHAMDRRNGDRANPAPTRAARKTTSAQPTRGRPVRTPPPDLEPPPQRPRRPRTGTPWPDESTERRRRRQPTTRRTRDPYGRREPHERRAPHDRLSRLDAYDPFEAYEAPPRRRPGTNGSTGANGSNGAGNGTHHPINQVRYRSGAEDSSKDRPARPRARSYEPDRWEYDD